MPSLPGVSIAVSVSAGTTLAELRRVLGAHRADVLLISPELPPTTTLVGALRRSLADDPSCATVSFDADARPSSRGIPPQTVSRPRRGVVVVRRDHLLLALDEQ